MKKTATTPAGQNALKQVPGESLPFFQEDSSGSLHDGLCYFITINTDKSLPTNILEDFRKKKNELLSLLSEAGIRGAKTKIKDYSLQIENLYWDIIEPCLNQEIGAEIISTPEQDWKAFLQEYPGIYLIDLVQRKNHLHLLLRWNSDQALITGIEDWKKFNQETEWATQNHIIQVNENRIDDFLKKMEMEKFHHPVEIEVEALPEISDFSFEHKSVLLYETVDMLAPAEGKVIIDATLGGGGHSEQLLERGATVIGIDQDPDARTAAQIRLARFGKRFRVLSGNFRDIAQLMKEAGIQQVDGILADIGVSSHQIDTASRGFSFREDGPLDMRMSPTISRTAADLVNTLEEKELARIFWEYGEERASRVLARVIVDARKNGPITTTSELARLAEKAIPRHGKNHPGTKIFQALRIEVNDELGALHELLEASISLLKEEGRLAIITFHSLEDRVVKRFFEHHSKAEIDRPEWPAPRSNPEHYFSLLNKKPITASEEELKANPRSRSAKLRGGLRNNILFSSL